MTVTDNVFPQSGDADYAENFATWLGRGNVSDYVETGMQFTVDYANNEVDISEGKAYIIVDQSTISSNDETRLVLDYTITTSSRTGVLLNADEENNLVYLNPNVSSNDSPSFEVETSTGAAASDWLLIGVIDTLNDSAETRNRDPSADFTTMTARDDFSLPAYSDPSNAVASESSAIYVDGTGSVDEGIYVHDGSGYISAGIREISKLNDVTGVVSVESNSASNRPAAGTQGRLFIDETNDRIQLDDGSNWVDIGTNSNNIGAGDLGFDPATQNELDTHTGTSDAHHTRPNAGNGLKDQTNTFNIEPADFVGQFLSDDADNIDVQIGFGLEDDGSGQIQIDEDASFTFTSQQIINNTLTMGGDIDLQNNNLIEPHQIQTSGSGSDNITFYDSNNSQSILRLQEGGEVEVNSGDLTDGSAIIFDQSASHVPLSILEHNSLTITAGDGLKNGGSVTLGSSTTVDIEPADFAGAHLSDDGADNLAVDDDFVLNTGDDISGALNFSASSSIQDAGVDAIQFDGARNVTVPNGSLTIQQTLASSATTLDINVNGAKRGEVDDSGNVQITGEITENATL